MVVITVVLRMARWAARECRRCLRRDQAVMAAVITAVLRADQWVVRECRRAVLEEDRRCLCRDQAVMKAAGLTALANTEKEKPRDRDLTAAAITAASHPVQAVMKHQRMPGRKKRKKRTKTAPKNNRKNLMGFVL